MTVSELELEAVFDALLPMMEVLPYLRPGPGSCLTNTSSGIIGNDPSESVAESTANKMISYWF